MYFDPYDDRQINFYRTDPTGRIVPLDTGDSEFSMALLRKALLFIVAVGVVTTLFWLSIAPLAQAEESPWTEDDTRRETVYLALHTMDWLQTRQMSKHPEMWGESNLILGSHPSTGKVNNYFAITGMMHYYVMKTLPDEYRKAFQYVTIGVEIECVANNLTLGVQIKF